MDKKKYHILYVDDEQQNLVAFKATFRKEFVVHTASNGPEAIETMGKHPIDLIISDQRMPGMTGVELFEKILPDYPEPIRMVLTGYSDIQSVINAINKGKVYHYITKPWKVKELRLIILNALESYQLRIDNRQLTEEKNELLLKTERQEKANILSQYETLKNQVNPHFLFNCLNALASLIHEDPSMAETFTSRLTRVYRYVLDLNQHTIVSVQQELDFLENYLFLQEIRFGENLQWNIRIEEALRNRGIPPLSLQLLAENAVKHNIISRQQPLTLSIYVEGEFLVVANNFQPRHEKIESTGIGLENLKKRYAFLSDQAPIFAQKAGEYIAKLPLMEISEY